MAKVKRKLEATDSTDERVAAYCKFMKLALRDNSRELKTFIDEASGNLNHGKFAQSCNRCSRKETPCLINDGNLLRCKFCQSIRKTCSRKEVFVVWAAMQYLNLSSTEAEQLYQRYGRSLKAAAAGAPDQSSSTATFEASGAAVSGKKRRSRSSSGDSDQDYALRTRRKMAKIVHSDEEGVDERNGLGNSDEGADFEKEAANVNERRHDHEKEAGMDIFEVDEVERKLGIKAETPSPGATEPGRYETSDEEEVDQLDPGEYNTPNMTPRPALIKSPFLAPPDPLVTLDNNYATTSPGAQPQEGEEFLPATANVAEQNHFDDLEVSAQECAEGDTPHGNSCSLSIRRRQETPAQAETTQGGDPFLTGSQGELQASNPGYVTPYIGFDYVHQLEDMKARLELIESQYERQTSTTRRLNEDLFKEQQKSARLEEVNQRLQFENARLSQQLEIAQRHQRTPFVIYKDWNNEKGGIDLKTSS